MGAPYIHKSRYAHESDLSGDGSSLRVRDTVYNGREIPVEPVVAHSKASESNAEPIARRE
jgi:hypothetical protein